MTLLAAVCLVMAVVLLLPRGSWSRLARLQPPRQRSHTARRGGRWWILVAVLGLTFAGLVGGGSEVAALCLSLAMIVVTGVSLWRKQRHSAAAAQRAEEIAEASQLMAGLVRVGHVPASALRLAAAESGVFAEAVAAQQVGGSVASTWQRQSTQPGGAGLAQLAAAWVVCEHSGASLTDTLDALAEHLDSSHKLQRMVVAELSAPKATGRMLAALPFAGLALGFAIGGNPVGFLLGSLLGQLCMVIGVALACAGVWWIERIADSVIDS